jgi:type II secretory pathway pseudopilin PulG
VKSLSHDRDGFSLIEVVIAMGIATFALISIFGLFSTSLTTSKDASSQQEGFEVERVIPSILAGTNFTNVNGLLNDLYGGAGSVNVFVYTATNDSGGVSTVVTNTAPKYISDSYGLVYCVKLGPSTNAPPNVFTNAAYNPSSLDLQTWPSVPVTARVYPFTGSTNTLSNAVPTMIFDFIIPR